MTRAQVQVEQSIWDADGRGREPDITFIFASLADLNDFMMRVQSLLAG